MNKQRANTYSKNNKGAKKQVNEQQQQQNFLNKQTKDSCMKVGNAHGYQSLSFSLQTPNAESK